MYIFSWNQGKGWISLWRENLPMCNCPEPIIQYKSRVWHVFCIESCHMALVVTFKHNVKKILLTSVPEMFYHNEATSQRTGAEWRLGSLCSIVRGRERRAHLTTTSFWLIFLSYLSCSKFATAVHNCWSWKNFSNKLAVRKYKRDFTINGLRMEVSLTLVCVLLCLSYSLYE